MRRSLAYASVGLLVAAGGAPPLRAGQEPLRVSVEYGDVSLDTIVEGRGPAVVLLPSLGRDSEDYGAVAAGLVREGFRVLRPQPRGIGRSSGPLSDLTLHDLARDVAEVIRQQGDGRAVVVGHAFGNWVARMTAADHPDLVRGVVVAAAASRRYDPSLSEGVTAASNPALPEDIRLAALERVFFAPGNDPRPWLDGWHPDIRDIQRQAAAAVPQAEWWAAGSAPILEIQADQDPFKTPDTRRELVDEFGDRVTVAVVPDASHALFPEQPEAVVEALRRWIEGLP